MRKLTIYLPVWTLLLAMGCWAAVASASEVLVPQMDNPVPIGASRHHLSQTPNGRLLLSWVEEGKEQTWQLRFSVLEDGEWTDPRTVVTTGLEFAARPMVLGLSDGILAAAWIERQGQNHKFKLYFSRSTDGGKHWSDPIQPASSKAKIYGAQLSFAPLKEGRLALVWTDMRAKPRFQVRALIIDTKGNPGPGMVLDSDTCSCCETSTVARNGTLWTAYRDHLKGEVRDISVVRWDSSGPIQKGIVHNDHWVISGCPSNGPAVDRRNGVTMATWLTVVDHMSYVRTAFQPEGADDFKAPIEVDRNANGYVNALLLENGAALVAWRDRAGPKEKLKLAIVRRDGTVHRTTLYRGYFPGWPSRHISLVKRGNLVYVTWKDAEQDRIRLVKVPLSSLTPATGAPAKAKLAASS